MSPSVPLRILGIDPGLLHTGWAVITAEKGSDPCLAASGLIATESAAPLTERLRLIHERLGRVLDEHQPDAVAAEELFFLKASHSIRGTLQARGVILLASAQRGLETSSYDPRTIKQSLTGNGASDKSQVQKMVCRLLRLQRPLSPDDVSDAAAIALCHWRMGRVKGLEVVGAIGGRKRSLRTARP